MPAFEPLSGSVEEVADDVRGTGNGETGSAAMTGLCRGEGVRTAAAAGESWSNLGGMIGVGTKGGVGSTAGTADRLCGVKDLSAQSSTKNISLFNTMHKLNAAACNDNSKANDACTNPKGSAQEHH